MPKTGVEHPLTAIRRRLAISPRPQSRLLATYGIPAAHVKTRKELLTILGRWYVNSAA